MSSSHARERSPSILCRPPSSVHLKQEEKLTVRCGRDGGVESLEVHGMIMLRVKSEDYGRVLVAVDNRESRNIQLQVRVTNGVNTRLTTLFCLDSSEYRQEAVHE